MNNPNFQQNGINLICKLFRLEDPEHLNMPQGNTQ